MILHLLLEQFQQWPVRIQMGLAPVALIQHLALCKFGKVATCSPNVQFAASFRKASNVVFHLKVFAVSGMVTKGPCEPLNGYPIPIVWGNSY